MPDYIDLEDPEFKLQRAGVLAERGRGGGYVPPPPPPGGGPPPGAVPSMTFSNSYGSTSEQRRRELIRRMQAAAMHRAQAQNMAFGGEVMGPGGVDQVPAMLTRNEGVLTAGAMRLPGVEKAMNLLNAIAALEFGPEGEAGGMPPEPEMEEPMMDEMGMGEEFDPLADIPHMFLGGALRSIPVVGKPMAKAVAVAAPFALQAMGVPLPVGAALSNFAMEGQADDLGGSAMRAGMAGGEAYVGGKLGEFKAAREMEAANKQNLASLPMPDAPAGAPGPDYSPVGNRYPDQRPRGYAWGGAVRPGAAQPGMPPAPRQPFAQPGMTANRPTAGVAAPRPFAPMGAQSSPQMPRQLGTPGAWPKVAPAVPPQAPAGPSNEWWRPQGQQGGMFGGAQQAGLFDPRGNPVAMEAAMRNFQRQGQADDRGDVNDLMAMDLSDPSMIASHLMGRRGERAYQRGAAAAGIAENQANRAQDFYTGMAKDVYGHEARKEELRLGAIEERRTKQTKGK